MESSPVQFWCYLKLILLRLAHNTTNVYSVLQESITNAESIKYWSSIKQVLAIVHLEDTSHLQLAVQKWQLLLEPGEDGIVKSNPFWIARLKVSSNYFEVKQQISTKYYINFITCMVIHFHTNSFSTSSMLQIQQHSGETPVPWLIKHNTSHTEFLTNKHH